MLNTIDGVEFTKARLNMQKIDLENDFTVNYIGLDDLVKNKKASGRKQDITDVKALQKIKRPK